MTYKHVQVVAEAYAYNNELTDIWDVINDICDYIKCRENGDEQKHYENCVLNNEDKS